MDENQEEQQGQESPEEKANKDTKKYLKVMETIKAVVGGEDNLKPVKKVDGDITAQIVAELFSDKQAKLKESVKAGLMELLEKHVELEVEVAKKRKECDDLQLQKRKEFTKAANAWLNKINQGQIMQASYATALETAFKDEKEKD